MDQDAIVTKKLHISGLTPAITKSDLSQRLASFGTVVSLDGFDKVDGVGRPRRFAYVTVKASKDQLSRCMNLLSGTTWKGTKLRIGEAKPDFRERIARENEKAAVEQPRKRRRLARGVQGTHAADMSLVTPANVHLRKGWQVTPLGRLIKPIRMRPLKPLPLLNSTHSTRKNHSDPSKKPKRRFKRALTRARRRTINPLRWGSQHLKGAFLAPIVVSKDDDTRLTLQTEEEQELEKDSNDSTDELQSSVTLNADVTVPSTAETSLGQPHDDLAKETMQSLTLLESMFAGLGEDQDWGDRESIDSDIEMGETTPPQDTSSVDSEREQITRAQPPATSANKLKDLFAPQEEEQGFSLLGHLDLDLEPEDEPAVPTAPHSQGLIDSGSVSYHHPSFATPRSQLTFDPKQPLFFPLTQGTRSSGNKAKDITDVMKDHGFDWREGFYRTESSEEIAKRWEETKGDLTRDWKRRHREAVKSRRRRGGGDDNS